jgi:RNA polymerase sigma-70 factor (ECF subfamily)
VEPLKGEELKQDVAALHADSFGWALACCRRDPEEAEEALQMTYLKIMTGKARFEGASSLKTWLFAVIRKTAAENRRKAFFATAGRARWLARRPAPHPVRDPESAFAASTAVRALHDALGRLSRRQQELLHLVFYQDLTVDEAATVLGLSPGTARTHYKRGKSRLRRMLPKEVYR